MSSLTDIDKRYLERILGMASGYVLDYSDPSFGEFIYIGPLQVPAGGGKSIYSVNEGNSKLWDARSAVPLAQNTGWSHLREYTPGGQRSQRRHIWLHCLCLQEKSARNSMVVLTKDVKSEM